MVKIEQVLRNENGENVLNDYFETITIKGNDIIVKKEGLSGLYDAVTYRKILNCDWDKIASEGDYFMVSRYAKVGLFDREGKVVLEAVWDRLVLCSNGILATNNGVQGFFKYDGTALLECVWKRIEPLAQCMFAYMGKGAKRVLYNYDGTIKEE